MAPPFSPSEEEAILGEEDESIPTTSTGRNPPIQSESDVGNQHRHHHHKLEDNALSNPILMDHLLKANLSESKKDAAEIEEEAEKRKSRKLIDPYDQPRNINKVTLEIPLLLQYPPDTTKKKQKNKSEDEFPKLVNLSQNARCSVHCYVPPSTPDGRWTSSISGNTNVFSTVGSANGAADITYKWSPRFRLLGGFKLLTTTDSRPLQLHVGALVKDPKGPSSIQASLRQQPKNHWAINIHTREIMDPWIITSDFGWQSKNSNQGKAVVWISSMTTHVVKLGFGWHLKTGTSSWLTPNSLVQLVMDPKLSSDRRLPVSLQYQPTSKTWNVGATLLTVRKNQKSKVNKAPTKANGPSIIPASWRIGIQGGGSTALLFKWSLVLAWQQGDVTLRIPIVLGTAASLLQRSETTSKTRSLVDTATPFLVIAIVGMANEMLSRFVWSNREEEESGEATTTSQSTVYKAKADAAAQQRLMQRQAETRTAHEVEKNGLVIQSAVYEFGDASSLDVTIPLQFWVQNDTSTLRLAEGSKQHLLGFYPINTTTIDEDTTTRRLENNALAQQQGRIPWWQEYWTPTSQRSKPKKASKEDPTILRPTLKVQYSYEGKEFEKNVDDDEALNLPDPAEIGA
ncbi:expressed unknown protein [Seminavis robusta]|uniref:DnaJ-like protein C11 C-terminal domain-containing protein n=1 Tax=Seminavis robusta TaxID=568900 RepID=A0A9N8H771_9STRA|nr:expressed unknown protein [Seminavis robusta]|eukprot:Sro61_g035210.1 n/a (626) ;mRNA; f:128524-130401